MKRRPKSLAESELQKRLEELNQLGVDHQEYREKRREIKKEMKELDRKRLKQERLSALNEYLEDTET